MAYEFPDVAPEFLIEVVQGIQLIGGDQRGRLKAFLNSADDDIDPEINRAVEAGIALRLLKADDAVTLPQDPLARVLTNASRIQRKVILRTVLWHDCRPFRTFCQLLASGSTPTEAAQKTKAIHSLSSPVGKIRERLLAAASYTEWVVEKSGEWKPVTHQFDPLSDFYSEVASIEATEESARQMIRRRLGEDAYKFLDTTTLENLVAAIIAWAERRPGRDVVGSVGLAIEGFLRKVATLSNPAVDLVGANGPEQMANRLLGAGLLLRKHKHQFGYLSAFRAAAQHDEDPEAEGPWDFSRDGQLTVILAALTAMRSTHNWVEKGISTF